MNSLKLSQIFTVVLLICAPYAAFAGQWSGPCKSSAEASKAACEGEAAKAKAGDSGDTARNMSRYGNASEIRNPGAAMNQHGTANASRFTAAKTACEQKQKECENKCKTQESQRKAAEANPQTRQAASADKAPMQEGEKICAAILPLIAELGAGAGQAAQAAADAAKTGGASNGMPLPLPIPIPGKDDKKEEGTKGENPVAEKLNCEKEGYSKYSDCNNHYINKCQNALTTAGCDGFISRYCGNTNTPTPAPAPMPGNDSLVLSTQTAKDAAVTANLVADKQGEGLGSAFCKKVTAYKYCQMAGRSECPSCKNINNPWPTESNPGQLADAQKACPTDPMFLDPTVQAQLNKPAEALKPPDGEVSTSTLNDRFSATPQSAGAAGGGGGGGNLGGAGGAGSVTAAPGQGVSEGPSYNGPSLSDSYGGGGGGGSSGLTYEGSASGPGYQPSSVNGNANRGPASAIQGGPADVANRHGPNIFSIQSTTYRDLCARGRLLHCRR